MAITEDPDNFNIIQCYIITISLYNLEIKTAHHNILLTFFKYVTCKNKDFFNVICSFLNQMHDFIMPPQPFQRASTHFTCCWLLGWVRCKTPSCMVGNLSNLPQSLLGTVRYGLSVVVCPCTNHPHVSCVHKLYLQPKAQVQLHCLEDKARCSGIC